MLPLKIVYQPPSALIENARNARTHSTRQVEQIARSITAFGFITPVLVDARNQIIAGHGRVRAAMMLGLEKVPTVSVEHLTDAQKRAFMIADNRIAELSGWDEQMLAVEFEELSSVDAPFEITDTGFELPKIDLLIEDRHKPKEEHDPADDPVAPNRVEKVARLGDLWLLGRHALFVGDARDLQSYRVLLGRERAQMVFIDPPYNCPIQGHVSGLGKVRHEEFVMASGEMTSAQFEAFLGATFECLVAASIDGSTPPIRSLAQRRSPIWRCGERSRSQSGSRSSPRASRTGSTGSPAIQRF